MKEKHHSAQTTTDVKQRSKKWRYGLGTLMVLLLVMVIGVSFIAWMIAPQREPGWGYTEPDIKSKIIEMIEQKKLEVSLTPEEFNNLARRELDSQMNELPPGVQLTGADFSWKGDIIQADVRGNWFGLPFGALLDFDAVREGNTLVLNHRYTTVRHGELGWPRLSPIRISLNKYIPAVAKVQHMEFDEQEIILTFKLDLFTLPRLFMR